MRASICKKESQRKMNTYGELLRDKIDADYAAKHGEDGMRTHLGASQIGEACWRKIWFGFRWADAESFDGRMLRLFERGQLEELRFKKLLELIGATVFTHDHNGQQFRIAEFGGHFGGSCDGVAINLPEINVPVLCEFKTHGEKSFLKLKAEGVHRAKPEHVKQAQTYCHKLKLSKILYVGISKNTDELYFELFDYDPLVGAQMIEKAEQIIFGGMPHRISENASWFECRYCSMQKICFRYKPAKVNCRTCRFSKPNRDGTWSCANGRTEISTQPKQGCGEHQYMTELL